MSDDPDVFLDSDIEYLENKLRDHPTRPFRLPRYTAACPACGRGVQPKMLEVPHYNPKSKPICASCRQHGAKWFRDPAVTEHMRKMRAKDKELGIEPKVGFQP